MLGLGSKSGASDGSPLETGVFRAQQTDVELRRLGRREWWLWFSALLVTVLSIAAMALSFWRPFFGNTDHFYNLRPDQAQLGTAGLLLVFNIWLVYRQWAFRRQRRKLSPLNQQTAADSGNVSDEPIGMDPVTGFYTRKSIEPHLGKEIGRAKRQNTPLSIATLRLDDFEQVGQKYGQAMSDLVLKEFVRRFKKAIHGSDFAVRLGKSDFAFVMPECSIDQVKTVLDRIGTLQVTNAGRTVAVTYSTGWVDYHQGDEPGDLVKRSIEILHLYDNAAKQSATPAPAVR